MKRNKTYYVARYFDDFFEAVIERGLSKVDAEKLQHEMNQLPRHYVVYLVREEF